MPVSLLVDGKLGIKGRGKGLFFIKFIMSLQIMSLSGKVFFREMLVKNGVCKKKLIEN